jgi:diguanylate cyclase (GGDEF)-like protein
MSDDEWRNPIGPAEAAPPQLVPLRSTAGLPAWVGPLLAAEGLASVVVDLTQRLPASLGWQDCALLLQDPECEVGQLLMEDQGVAQLPARLHLVDSLLGLGPQTQALTRPWVGRFAAVDHGLLLPGAAGPEHVAIIPLERFGRIFALYCLGGSSSLVGRADDPPVLAEVGAVAALALEAALGRRRLARVGFDDPLTGWHRERYLWSRLREELARSARNAGSVALAAIDIVAFRGINARCGRTGGDLVLRELTARVDAVLRNSDSTVRLHDDRFMVLLPATGDDGASRVVDRIRDVIAAAPFDLGGGVSEEVRAAVGYAAATPGRSDDLKGAAERLYAEALVALARAKR